MMETILNLGLNDETVEGLAQQSGNPTFAWDSYRRFVQMYGSVVFDLPRKAFEHMLDEQRRAAGVTRDIDLPVAVLKEIVRDFKARVKDETGNAFPEPPIEQLWGAVAAVFESWNTQRAIDYRRLHDIPDTMGTAVNVVAMVFGNIGEDSGTGVAFTRDPSTGEHRLYGEYLINAQGEDVVSGIRTPEPIGSLAAAPPGVLSRAGAYRAPAGATLPRRAGHGVHHRARQALHAADPPRPALRSCGGAHRLRDGGRGRHLAGGGGEPHTAQRPRPAPAPDDRSAQRARPAHHGAAGVAGRRLRHHGVRCRPRRADGPRGAVGHPGPRRNVSRGLPRHGAGQGDPHCARRHDLPCGRGGARHGQALRRRQRSISKCSRGSRCFALAIGPCAKATGSRWMAAPERSMPGRLR